MFRKFSPTNPLVAVLLDWEPIFVLFRGALSCLIIDKFAFYLIRFCTFKVIKIVFESLCLITRTERSKYFLQGVFSGVSKGVNVKNLGTSPLAPFQPLPCGLMRGVELQKIWGQRSCFQTMRKENKKRQA